MNLGGINNNFENSRRNNFSVISIFLLLIFFPTLILYAVYWNNQKKIKRYEIENLQYYASFPMDSLLSRMINQKFELKEIKSEIEKLDFVALCKIYKKDSETLKLEIVEKEPLAVVRNVSGQCFLVTIDFDLISSANLKQTSYPIIEWGEEEVSNFVEKNLVLLMILKRVKKEYPEIYKSISEVVGNGDEICLVTKSTRTKILTTTKDLLQDLEIISALLKRNDMGKFLKNTIDLRFDNIMVVR